MSKKKTAGVPRSLTIDSFRDAAQAALYEAELNALKDRQERKMQDRLWEYFDILEEIAMESNSAQAGGGSGG